MKDMTNNYFILLIGVTVSISSCVKTESSMFTSLDINVFEHLNKYLKSQCVVFVEENEDVSKIKKIKKLSGYYTVLNSSLLENILLNNVLQLRFFQRRTVIVTKEILNLTSLINKVSSPHYLTWIIFRDYTLFPDLYIPANSEVFFINSTREMVSVKQVYNLKPGIKETVTTLWSWNLTQSLSFFPVVFRHVNFHNVSLDMLVLTSREGCQEVHKESLMKKLECLHQDFLESMGRRLNFSVNVVECMEKEYPFTYPNGSDSELFLKLKNREVHFSAIGHVILTQKGRNYMDFVWPTFVLKAMMYLKQGRLTGRWNSYLKPLESFVWWGILMWIVVTGILIKVFEKLLVNDLKCNFSLMGGFVISILEALQVFCNQAIFKLSTSISIRIIYFSEFFIVLIFFQAYCGYLISSLTVVVPEYPFKDLEGLYENEQYRVMTLQRGFNQFFFRKIIGKGQREDFMLPQQELPDTIQAAVEKLCSQDYLAFPEFKEDFLNFEKLTCNILQLPSPVVSLYVGIAMPKPSPLKEYLKRELFYLKSAGLVERLRSRLSFQSSFQDKNSEEEFGTVSVMQIFSAFIFLGMGILFSIVIFVIELLFEKEKRRRLS